MRFPVRGLDLILTKADISTTAAERAIMRTVQNNAGSSCKDKDWESLLVRVQGSGPSAPKGSQARLYDLCEVLTQLKIVLPLDKGADTGALIKGTIWTIWLVDDDPAQHPWRTAKQKPDRASVADSSASQPCTKSLKGGAPSGASHLPTDAAAAGLHMTGDVRSHALAVYQHATGLNPAVQEKLAGFVCTEKSPNGVPLCTMNLRAAAAAATEVSTC